MLILHTAHSYSPDVTGVAEVVKQLSSRLVLRGHEVHVATEARAGAPSRQEIAGVVVHRFNVCGNQVEGIRGDVRGYLEFVRSRQWDVIAMHCTQAWPTDALLPEVAKLRGVKVLVSHGLSALNSPAYAKYFKELALSLGHFDRLVALSPLLEEVAFARHHGLLPPEIIPNGVDPNEWTGPCLDVRNRWNIGSRPWVLSVSNHSSVKGHAVFGQALDAIRHSGHPTAIGSIIGGHYPAAKHNLGRLGIKGGCWYRCRLKSFLGNHVQLHAGVPRSEVVSAVREADLLLITSSREASPLVALEAMAAGTPWIALDKGAIRENSGGMVVQSLEEMVGAAADLLSNMTTPAKPNEQRGATVAEKYQWESIVSKYEHLYSRLISSAQRDAECMVSQSLLRRRAAS